MSARACSQSLVALAATVACNPPVHEVQSVAPPPVVELGPACAPPPAAALALLADAPCPWILVPGDGTQMALRATDMVAPRALVVAPPEDCAGRCEFTGAATAVGPVLLASRLELGGERADAAFVGAALGGGVVRFAPLWFGRPARGDSSELGPSHALVPWVCGDALVLGVGGRLPAAAAEEATDGLRRAAGVYVIADDELRRSDQPIPDFSTCTRVPLELP